MGELRILATRPRVAKKVMEVLNSGPKVRILEYLNRVGEAGAKSVAEALGVKLSTALEHLNDLVEIGLIKTVYRDSRKRYLIAASKIVIEVDLPLYISTYLGGPSTPLEAKALKLFEELRRSGGVPVTISVDDARRVLGVDREEALKIIDLINFQPGIISSRLGELIIEYLSKRPAASLTQISRDLNVHIYWVALAVERLVKSSRLNVSKGRVSLP